MDPEKKKNELYFTYTKYVIPKSWKVSHWPSKTWLYFSSAFADKERHQQNSSESRRQEPEGGIQIVVEPPFFLKKT